MQAIVYRCRSQGRRLDPETIKADPVRGDLVVLRRGFNKRMAVLLGPDGKHYVLPLLDKVRLLAMNDRGVLLAGYETHPPRGSKGSGPIYPQSWWCLLRGTPERTQVTPGGR